jgi:hypothetical protein
MQEVERKEKLQKAYLLCDKAIQEKNMKEVLKQMEIINNLKSK